MKNKEPENVANFFSIYEGHYREIYSYKDERLPKNKKLQRKYAQNSNFMQYFDISIVTADGPPSWEQFPLRLRDFLKPYKSYQKNGYILREMAKEFIRFPLASFFNFLAFVTNLFMIPMCLLQCIDDFQGEEDVLLVLNSLEFTVTSLLKSILYLILTPLSIMIIPLRGLLTLLNGPLTFQDGVGVQAIINETLKTTDALSFVVAAVCLHNKTNRAVEKKRDLSSDFIADEQSTYNQIRRNEVDPKAVLSETQKNLFLQYFSLFKQHPKKLKHEGEKPSVPIPASTASATLN